MFSQAILKFGPATISTVLNMTKDSLIFSLCFHREINIFAQLLRCPVSGHNYNNVISLACVSSETDNLQRVFRPGG